MTHTYPTTNIVLDAAGLTIWVEDFSYDTPAAVTNPFRDRVGRFLNRDHVRIFTDWSEFTMWLHEVGAIVDKCWILGETLTDEERQG